MWTCTVYVISYIKVLCFQLEKQILFQIKNVESEGCLDTFGRKSGENAAMGSCHGLGGNQVFAYTKRQQIMSDDNCLDAASVDGPVKLIRCHGMGGNQMWKYDEKVIKFRMTSLISQCNGIQILEFIQQTAFTCVID
ncbi:polypeptide N-acetylgalactosaminyltransferase 5-like [Limulus polyphemus]|uniref:Polypeptide N-acetylgalactosaminyltransferase 5-like n=1 Tax=Limulus polyphemus TaxID=6850 RepID=A0ABM1RZF8_LIMPO|nr:polypeptide N-acetylgalactosaminyltransferase 5-like [Limulus polyphemus]